MPSEQKWINNWKTRRRKAKADFFFYIILECFSYESQKSFVPWILPPFSPRRLEFLLEKGGGNTILPFPRCPLLILNGLWIKRKEWSWILFFGCLGLWLEVGLAWEWKELFLVGNFAYESLLCEASCSFMSFPRGTCLLGGTSHSCLSPCVTLSSAFLRWWLFSLTWGWRQAGLCWVAVGPRGSGRRSPRGLALAGSQLRCWCAWLCLTLAGLVDPLNGFAFFPASGSNLFTPNTSLIEVIVSDPLWSRMPGICWLPRGHVWVIWALTFQLITAFQTTKQCWGSRLGLYWGMHW